MKRFRNVVLTATAFACIGGQAMALSCARPDVRQSFNWWAEASDPYYISVGTLTPTEPLPKVPQFDGTNQNLDPVTAEYRFVGEVLWTDDQPRPIDRPVTVTVDCIASWCGDFPNAKLPRLMALKVEEGGGLSLSVGPCGGSFFEASHAEMIRGCLRAGQCETPEPQ